MLTMGPIEQIVWGVGCLVLGIAAVLLVVVIWCAIAMKWDEFTCGLRHRRELKVRTLLIQKCALFIGGCGAGHCQRDRIQSQMMGAALIQEIENICKIATPTPPEGGRCIPTDVTGAVLDGGPMSNAEIEEAIDAMPKGKIVKKGGPDPWNTTPEGGERAE